MLSGVFVVAVAGLVMGGGVWPMKLMRSFRFEHWWLIASAVGLVIIPWSVTLAFCPSALVAYAGIPARTLLLANLFSLSWGAASVLCGLCYVRIGVGLTGAILTGLGVSLGVMAPMVFKGSGLFANAPDVGSRAGLVVLAGVGLMLAAVVLVSVAGFGRDRALKDLRKTTRSFAGGLVMAIAAGVLSCGISFAFVYSQGPIPLSRSPTAAVLRRNCSRPGSWSAHHASRTKPAPSGPSPVPTPRPACSSP